MSNANWNDNSIQYPRLIAELQAVGAFRPSVMRDLCESMDLEHEDVLELVDRAVDEWDEIKQST